MKTKETSRTLVAVTCLVFACLFSSCSKNASGTSTSTTVSEQDAADAITEAVTPESGGVTAQVSDASAITLQSSNINCGELFDSTITMTNATGAAVTYSLNLAWQYKLSCATPASLTASFSGQSSYDAARISSSDSSSGSFIISGLEASNTSWIFNASYVRKGTELSKIGNKNSFSSIISIQSTNLEVDKVSGLITSGSSSVSISGESSAGKSFSYTGTITFTGNQTATLQIANGNSYQLTW